MGITLTKIIVSQIVVIMIATGFWLFLSEGIDTYNVSVPSDYNDTFITLEATLGDLNSSVDESRGDLGINTSGAADRDKEFLSFFFNSAYSATKSVKGGVESLYTFTNLAVENTPLSGFGKIIINGFGIMIAVTIVIFLLSHFVIKSERV